MITHDHFYQRPWMSPFLDAAFVSTVRATESRRGGVCTWRRIALAHPLLRMIEQPLMVWRRNLLRLGIFADGPAVVRPSSRFVAVIRICAEIGGTAAGSVRRFRRRLATAPVIVVDQRGPCESAPCCAQPFLSLGVGAHASLSATQTSAFTAARQRCWSPLSKPAVLMYIHTRWLQRRAPRRSIVMGDCPSCVSAHARLSCSFRRCGVIPWP